MSNPQDPATSPANPPLRLAVPPEAAGERLDVFLSRALKDAGLSREKLKKIILQGRVSLNGQPCLSPKAPLPGPKPAARETGQAAEQAENFICIDLPETQNALVPEDGELTVLYRDESLLVLNKSAGLTVHPCPSCPQGTLVHRLLAQFPELAALEGERPGIVHRLDKDTSGLLLVALRESARLKLAEAFAARAVHKEYLALAHGVPKEAASAINAPIDRHPTNKTRMAVVKNGREALSEYRTLYADPLGRFSLLAVRIHTGRTHQIRVHLAHIGHPILGDRVYNDARHGANAAPRQMLHAWKLHFTHPETGPESAPEHFGEGTPKNAKKNAPKGIVKSGKEMSFCAPPPPDFLECVASFTQRRQRVVLTGLPGSGKSSVLAELAKRGHPVFSADKEVARLYEKGGEGWRILKRRYGERFVPEQNAPVDKKALFTAMYEDDDLRREVEAFIHPMVEERLSRFWAKQEGENPPPNIIPNTPRNTIRNAPGFAEIPLFFESPCMLAEKGCPPNENGPNENGPNRSWPGKSPDKNSLSKNGKAKSNTAPTEPALVVGIKRPQKLRRELLQSSRGWGEDMFKRMEAWQWPEEKKLAACNLLLDNSGPLEALPAQVEKLLQALQDLQNTELAGLEQRFAKLWKCHGNTGGK